MKNFVYEHDMYADDNDGESNDDDNGLANLLQDVESSEKERE